MMVEESDDDNDDDDVTAQYIIFTADENMKARSL
jgi:hypothetical protein